MDFARAGVGMKEIIVDVTESIKETRESAIDKDSSPECVGPPPEEQFVDPRDEVLGDWQWARIYYDAFMSVVLPTIDVLTDWASLISIAVSPYGGLLNNDCLAVNGVGDAYVMAAITLLVATINGTVLWAFGAYIFSRRWSKLGTFREKLRVALEGVADDQSTRFLCRKGEERGKFHMAHCHQIATLLLEDFPSLMATLILSLTLGATTATLVSFFVSVLSFSKLIASYVSLGCVLCCRNRKRRTMVLVRFACCSLFCLAVAGSFIAFPIITFASRRLMPQVLPVRSWHVRIPALGVDRLFVAAADDLRVLDGPGFVLFGGVDGTAAVRVDQGAITYIDLEALAAIHGGDFSTLPFDDALVIDMYWSFYDLWDEYVSVGGMSGNRALLKLWRRGCDRNRNANRISVLPTIAIGAFVSDKQECLASDWVENCKISSVRMDPPIDFFGFNQLGGLDVNKPFRLTLWGPSGIDPGDVLACADECFRSSPFCTGFGERNRSQVAYAEVDITFGVTEKLCLN